MLVIVRAKGLRKINAIFSCHLLVDIDVTVKSD